ncbi:hypothetical protein QQP08_001540 [Theobroma cacao]|nr:hypothetical protein QQP08_001540 [Theobroma cacao]
MRRGFMKTIQSRAFLHTIKKTGIAKTKKARKLSCSLLSLFLFAFGFYTISPFQFQEFNSLRKVLKIQVKDLQESCATFLCNLAIHFGVYTTQRYLSVVSA